ESRVPTPQHDQELKQEERRRFTNERALLEDKEKKFYQVSLEIQKVCSNPQHDLKEAKIKIDWLARLGKEILDQVNQINKNYTQLSDLDRKYANPILNIRENVLRKLAEINSICTDQGETPPAAYELYIQAELEGLRQYFEREIKPVCDN